MEASPFTKRDRSHVRVRQQEIGLDKTSGSNTGRIDPASECSSSMWWQSAAASLRGFTGGFPAMQTTEKRSCSTAALRVAQEGAGNLKTRVGNGSS